MTRRLALLALTAACAAPTTPTVALRGEAKVTVGTVSAPSPVARLAAPRPQVSKASRSRVTATPKAATGSLLSVTCYTWTGNRTASGKWPRVGMAAGPWPFGTKLRVEHVGIVTVEDRYGSGTQLDLYGPSEDYCRQFGRQHLLVKVVR